MSHLTRDELLDVLEAVFTAQLRAVRALRPGRRAGSTAADGSTSNIKMVVDLLQAAGGPLHIRDILGQAQARFGRRLNRESLVSALTKKVLDGNTFVRTGPNTFDLLRRASRPPTE